MKTYQRVNSRGVECEPQQGPDWVGLVISRESTSASVPSAWIMPYRMWFLCFEYLLYNEIMCWFLEQSHVCCDNKDVNGEMHSPTTVFSIYGYTVRVVSQSCSLLTSIFQWGWCSFCSLAKGSGVWLAPGAGSGSVCKHGSCLDLLWADASTGLTSGPGAGEMKLKNWVCSEKGADRQSILAVKLSM